MSRPGHCPIDSCESLKYRQAAGILSTYQILQPAAFPQKGLPALCCVDDIDLGRNSSARWRGRDETIASQATGGARSRRAHACAIPGTGCALRGLGRLRPFRGARNPSRSAVSSGSTQSSRQERRPVCTTTLRDSQDEGRRTAAPARDRAVPVESRCRSPQLRRESTAHISGLPRFSYASISP